MIFSKQFVCATEKYSTLNSPIPNPQFRKSFSLDSIPGSAEITVCGLGYYRLYINGKDITKGYMAPYRSNPEHYLYYDNYDISEYLKVGENVIGVLLGNGIINSDYPIWDFDKAPFRSSPKLALSVELDGVELFDAREFLCTESPIIFEEFHLGEEYDARLETDGWLCGGYCDKAWRKVIPTVCPAGEARIPDCEPIKVISVRRPVRIIKTNDGYIYDFVVTSAGFCQLNIKGERGQNIVMRHGEILRNGKLDVKNISFSQYDKAEPQRICYTLKGGENETYEPHFSYQGFRFVEVTGITEEQATLDLLTFYEISSNFEQIGDFKCDNKDINAIFDAVIRSDRSNFMYFPTDCPQREKNGWTGDVAFSAEQLLTYFDSSRSLKEWLRNVFKTQNSDGAIPGIVPTDTWGFAWGNGPAWDDVMFELPLRIYQYTGDKDFINEAVPYLLKYLKYLDGKRDGDGLLHYGLGDWCHISFPTSAVNSQLPLTDTIIGKAICDKAAVLFELIDDKETSDYAKQLSRELKSAYARKNPKAKNQSIAAMCLYYGMTDECENEGVLSKLKSHIHAHNDHMNVGVLGERALFRALGENHESELALKMILNPTFPSFKFNVDNGMTSLAENFKYIEHRIDKLTDDDATLDSLNHHFWGDIASFFMRHLAGIQVDNPEHICIAPDLVDDINNLTASVKLPTGLISVAYKKCDIMVEITISIPKNVSANAKTPVGYVLSHGNLSLNEGLNHLIFYKK